MFVTLSGVVEIMRVEARQRAHLHKGMCEKEAEKENGIAKKKEKGKNRELEDGMGKLKETRCKEESFLGEDGTRASSPDMDEDVVMEG